MRVLAVDDHEENLYFLRALLTGHGHEVQVARHGAEALVLARQSPPDVIISDLLMPVMDGYTLLRHWKADARLSHVPFIVYTATYTEPEDERLALSLGADAFILKPCEPDAFVVRLREVAAKAGAEKPVEPQRPSGDPQVLLREYSETLVRKLEAKTLQLEETNKSLHADIAARTAVEATLRETEERFRQLAANIDDVVWLRSAVDNTFFFVSPAYEKIWGRTCESVYSTPSTWLDGVHPEDRERLRQALPKAALGTYDEVFRVVRPDGSVRTVRSRAYPVRNAAGEVYRIAGVSRDITEQRRLEEQVRQAQKMEAVGRLAGGIAHDFNNILSVILGYTTLVIPDLPETGNLRADIEEVRNAGERAAELTQQLLAFSRKQVRQPRVLDLSQSLLSMQTMLRRLLGEHIQLVLHPSDEACRVHADASQMEQVILNLAVNARDAMPDGGTLSIETTNVELRATSVAGAPPGAYVALSVADTGAGMDAETRDRVFEPFFTTKESGKGTGLGLSTVFGIVKQGNGHVTVESEPGRGTKFTVYLPRTDLPGNAVSERPSPSRLASGTETILVVEDDEHLRTMTCAILRRHGYTVLDAQNGGEAYLVSEQFRGTIHLLLTDVVMPRMSGRELADRLAAPRPDMRVLFVSGYAEDAGVHGSVLRGAASFLPKPITPESLLRKVREVLDVAPS